MPLPRSGAERFIGSFLLFSRLAFRWNCKPAKVEGQPGGKIPRSIQIYLAEGCAPTFADVQQRVAARAGDLGYVLARRVPVRAFWRYRVSLQRKKCCQQIIGLNDEPFSRTVKL